MEGLLMAYRLKTFRVQFVAEPALYPTGSPCRASEDVERIARSIFGTLDADKEHFLFARDEQQEPRQRVQGRVNRKPYRVASSSTRGMANGAPFVRSCGRFCSQPPERRSCTQSRGSRNHSQTEGDWRHPRDSRARSCRAWRWAVLLV